MARGRGAASMDVVIMRELNKSYNKVLDTQLLTGPFLRVIEVREGVLVVAVT